MTESSLHNSLEYLFREQYDNLVKRVNWRVKDIHDAEDIVMSAFERALRYQASFDIMEADRSLSNWFLTILDNVTRTFQADKHRLGMALDWETFVEEEEEHPIVEDRAERKELLEKIFQEIEKESIPLKKKVFLLHFKAGFTPLEIQELLPLPPRTLYNTILRFKEKIEKKYGEKSMR